MAKSTPRREKTHKKAITTDVKTIETVAKAYITYCKRPRRKDSPPRPTVAEWADQNGVSVKMLNKAVDNDGIYVDKRTLKTVVPKHIEESIIRTLKLWSANGESLPDDSCIRAFIYNLLQAHNCYPTSWGCGIDHNWFYRFKKSNKSLFTTRKKKQQTIREVRRDEI